MFFNLIKEINRLRWEINRLLTNVFNSVNEINRLGKEINKLLSKGISISYIEITFETSPKLQFSGFKTCVTRSVLGSSNSCRYHWITKLLVAT